MLNRDVNSGSSKDEIFKNLPLPGVQFEILDHVKKSQAYDDICGLMITYKEELNKVFEQMEILRKEKEDQIALLKSIRDKEKENFR